MNELIGEKSVIIILQNYFKKNYKVVLSIIFFTILILFLWFIYVYQQNNSILKTSLQYNEVISESKNIKFEKNIKDLSVKKNFYGTLASLEKIKIDLRKKNINSAYDNYLILLNDKKLNIIYKSTIATNGSYSLLNLIESADKKSFLDNDLLDKIKKLTSYIDDSLESFKGYKLEIMYLISVLDYDVGKISFEEIKIMYQQIQENDKISSSLKERVKKIHEFQKYK